VQRLVQNIGVSYSIFGPQPKASIDALRRERIQPENSVGAIASTRVRGNSGRKIRETKIDEKNKGHWTKRSWRKNIARTYLLSTARESLCTCARREKNIPHPDPLSRPTEQSNVQSLENFISEEYADDSRTGDPYVGIDIALDRFREFRSLQGQGDQRGEGYLHQEGYPQSPGRLKIEPTGERNRHVKVADGRGKGQVNREEESWKRGKIRGYRERGAKRSRIDIQSR